MPHRSDRHALPEHQDPADQQRRLVVQDLLPPFGGDKLGQDDRDQLILFLLLQFIDVIEQGPNDRAIGGL